MFNMDRMTNTQNSHAWLLDNLHVSMETQFQSCFLVINWCSIIQSQAIRQFVLEEPLTSGCYLSFLEDELPVLLKGVPLHIKQEVWLQQDGTPPPPHLLDK
jgi:hypothetical protein